MLTRPSLNFGNRILRIFFQDDSGSQISIDFRLYDHPVAKKWEVLMLNTLMPGHGTEYDVHFFGNGFNDKKNLIHQLNQTIISHNEFCKQHDLLLGTIPIIIGPDVNAKLLGRLHDYFEVCTEDQAFFWEKQNLAMMNILIHRTESCLIDGCSDSHVEILPNDAIKLPLLEEDYAYFNPDHLWGQVELTYGITGVPTFNAFMLNSEPTPQNMLTNGILLSFRQDQFFSRYDELSAWLKTKGLDINDPKIAFGILPLGMLNNMNRVNRKEFMEVLSRYTHLSHISYHDYSEVNPDVITWCDKSKDNRSTDNNLMYEDSLDNANGIYSLESIALALYEHDHYFDKSFKDFYLQERSRPSLGSIPIDLIKENEWQAFLEIKLSEGKKFAVILGAGVYITDATKFLSALTFECKALRSKGWPAAGLLRVFREGDLLPYFHEQILIVNLEIWAVLGKVPLGSLFSDKKATLRNAEISTIKVEYGFSPLFLKYNPEHSAQEWTANCGWGSQLMIETVKAGKGVMSISDNLSQLIIYAHPRDPLTTGRDKIEQLVTTHAQVKKLGPSKHQIIAPNLLESEARWPFDKDIFYHLDLVPYIDLGVEFNSIELLAEANNLLDRFVTHRDYDQSSGNSNGKWKSAGLRSLFGDYTKTQYHTEYSFEGQPKYMNTALAELCPKTMAFLSRITDLEQCQRVRFMLLEPGASISTHRDSQDRDVSLAVNISLNMPSTCDFFAQLNSDGTSNPYSVRVPFKDSGSVMLFNNAKYHRVTNNSKIPRLHIIFHGPIKSSDQDILMRAQAQNGVSSRKELIKRIIQKKFSIGEELTKNPDLMVDWLSSGLNHDTLPPNFCLAVYSHAQHFEDSFKDFYLERRTKPSLFPLAFEVIQENEWDQYLCNKYESGHDFAVIMAAGIFIRDLPDFLNGLNNQCIQLRKKAWPVAGHILNFPHGPNLPHFHEQMIIVNLKVWSALPRIAFGPLFGVKESSLVGAHISQETIHDDYTPMSIEASAQDPDKVNRTGRCAWGSEVIARAVVLGKGVMNFSAELRNSKIYAYPRDEISADRKRIESEVEGRLNRSREEVFFFNNELLNILEIPSFKPNKLISVSAGMKPFKIIQQFGMSAGSSVHFLDFSKLALRHMKSVCQQTSFKGLKDLLKAQVGKLGLRLKTPEQVSNQLDNILIEFFSGQEELLMESLKVASNATFEEVDLTRKPELLVKYLSPEDKFVIWISNVFYNNQIYMVMSHAEAESRWIKLVGMIASKTSNRAFRYENSRTIIFGRDFENISGLITDGCLTQVVYNKEHWNEIKF